MERTYLLPGALNSGRFLCGVSGIFLVEVVLDDVGASLRGAQVGSQVVGHFGEVLRAAASQGVGFDVLVEQFVGI